MAQTISVEDAQNIVWDKPITRQEVSEHRWYTRELVVFDHEGTPMGFYYLDPASEIQEDQDRFEADPVPIFAVVSREVVATVWAVAGESA